MTAALAVAPDVAAPDSTDGPQLLAVTSSPTALKLAFAAANRNSRLVVGDTVLAREDDPDTAIDPGALESAPGSAAAPEQNPENGGEDEAARFVVPHGDFARAILSQRPLVIDGTAFSALVSVGGTALEVLEPTGPPSAESPSATVTLREPAAGASPE